MILSLLADGQFPDDLLEEAFSVCPESWDGDESAESILLAYIAHLEQEVVRLGGCLHRWCRSAADGERCDHGYPEGPSPWGDR